MNNLIQKGIVLLVFSVPLVFSHATTEVYGLVKVTVLELGALLLLVLWLIKISKGSQIAVGRMGWAVLAFFGAALLSLFKAGNLHEGIKFIYQLGAGIGLFFLLLNNVKEKKQVNEIVLAMVLAGVIAALFNLYENRGIKFGSLRLIYTSTFGNPVFFAQYLSLAIPLSLAMCLEKKIFSRLFFALAAALMLAFFVLTRSRGAYLGLFVAGIYCCIIVATAAKKGTFLFLASREGKNRNVPFFLITGGLLFFLAAFSAGLVFSTQFRGWAGENLRFRNLARVQLWGSTLRMAIGHPVLGVGAGNFKVAYPLYRNPKERETVPKGVKYSKAHNDFLQVWAETGTLGLVSFLAILWALLPFILHPLRQRAGPSAHISLGLAAGMVAFLVQACFNPLLYVPTSGMGFWVLLGLIALTERNR